MAEMAVWSGSTWRSVTELAVWSGSTWRNITEAHVWSGSAWRLVYSAAAAVVTLTNIVVDDFSVIRVATAGMRINSDGTIDKRTGTAYAQIAATTDWIIPNGDADSTYEVRVTGVSGTFSSAAAGNNVWVSVSGSPQWYVQDATTADDGQRTVSGTLQIRKDGGAVIDSCTFSLTAEYTNTLE